MTCCPAPQVKDLYCASCKAHTWRGVFYTRREWDEWVNDTDEEDEQCQNFTKQS